VVHSDAFYPKLIHQRGISPTVVGGFFNLFSERIRINPPTAWDFGFLCKASGATHFELLVFPLLTRTISETTMPIPATMCDGRVDGIRGGEWRLISV
jgi:hypothetical protein